MTNAEKLTVERDSSNSLSDQSNQQTTARPAVFSGQHKISVANPQLRVIYRQVSVATVLIPFLGTLLAIALLFVRPISPLEISLFLVMYTLTVLGVEVGYHRLFAHRAFQVSTPIKAALAILGSMAAQGGCFFWVAHHRRHHQYTELPEDPHSPHLHGNGFLGKFQGLWHAQMGWVMAGEITNTSVFAKDMIKDPLLTRINKLQHVWVLLGLVIPSLIALAVSGGSLMAALEGFLWGGLVRIFAGQQVVNATNSICHFFGARPFDLSDRSTNNLWLAIPSMGMSWHNNHHAFPTSATAGLRWWQIDLSTGCIRLLETLGQAWSVKVPSPQKIALKQAATK